MPAWQPKFVAHHVHDLHVHLARHHAMAAELSVRELRRRLGAAFAKSASGLNSQGSPVRESVGAAQLPSSNSALGIAASDQSPMVSEIISADIEPLPEVGCQVGKERAVA
jgi:hypothetical protein